MLLGNGREIVVDQCLFGWIVLQTRDQFFVDEAIAFTVQRKVFAISLEEGRPQLKMENSNTTKCSDGGFKAKRERLDRKRCPTHLCEFLHGQVWCAEHDIAHYVFQLGRAAPAHSIDRFGKE